jgi:hypothetical protein
MDQGKYSFPILTKAHFFWPSDTFYHFIKIQIATVLQKNVREEIDHADQYAGFLSLIPKEQVPATGCPNHRAPGALVLHSELNTASTYRNLNTVNV